MKLETEETILVRVMFALILVTAIICACSSGLPESNIRPQGETGGSVYYTINWVQITPPHDGLRCWAAQWDNDNGYQGMAISYCEEIE